MCKKDTSELVINNGTITDPTEVANEFNKYFVSIGQTLSRNVQSNRSYDEYLVENTVLYGNNIQICYLLIFE